ncbi:mRNA cap guanine-N7 methyltransferase 2-like isoform X2 [Salvia splendens]|uniref:mRNA cap guanine-N7 methyltransferase 2-like isoform X2 n=1 Tax=Salvia splendens TaxID=180675 RepID=UPI001C278FC5|nr:mRNA cap guanine-N7 methyltransferase 2-like isoform X2 [Salvia splendens]
MLSSFPPPRPTESIHHRLIHFVKAALINIFVSPYATVCDLYCGKVPDEEKLDEAQIGHYIGIDVATSGVNEVREAWESRRKAYTSEFLEFDPCIEDVCLHWKDKENKADIVFCMEHLPLCVENEEKVRRLLHNVSSLLKPGGYFLGITPDSSTIWAKYQKNVEAYHNKAVGLKPNIFPNCIRSESYMITFEVEEEKFPFFGKKYQLKFSGDMSAETHCLVHFPSLISLLVGWQEMLVLSMLRYKILLNFMRTTGMLMDAGHNIVDQRGRLLQRSYDVLGLYTTFIFRKPDPDITPPLMTPLLEDGNYNHDEVPLAAQSEWQAAGWRDEEKIVPPESSSGPGKISEQKGILGPGPAELRFPEAI